jgi:phage tail tape-measure protein
MHKITDIAMGVLVLAGIFTLVRPNSQGPAMVTNIANGFAGVIGAATGGGSF